MCKKIFGIIFMGLGVLLIGALAAWGIPDCPDQHLIRLWMAGAGALGLVSGFTTGLSTDAAGKTEFMKFLVAGVSVPLLGGVAALMGKTQEVTENSTYSSTQLVEKTTKTVTSLSDGSLHPLAVVGSFFLMFGVVAILGIVSGMLLRKNSQPGIMAGFN